MDSIRNQIVRRNGLAATHELYAAGFGRADIAAAVRSRRIVRVRQGWFAMPATAPILLSAARVGGRATCITGLRLQGVWVGSATGFHVACAAHDARLRSTRDSRKRLTPTEQVTVHWRRLPPTGSRLMLNPLECLRDALTCLDVDDVALSADSLLHEHPGLRRHWRSFLADVPAVHRPRLARADGICESGIETKIWLDLQRRGLLVQRQAKIEGVGFVDFLIGSRLVIEADGSEYHTDPVQFEDDRRRDAMLAALGYRVLRFSYRQVIERWREVDAAISAVAARSDAR